MTTHGTTVVITERRWEHPPASTSVHVGGGPSRDGHDDHRRQCYIGQHADWWLPTPPQITCCSDRLVADTCGRPVPLLLHVLLPPGMAVTTRMRSTPLRHCLPPPPAAIRALPLSVTRCGGDRDSRDAGPATAWRGGRLALRATSLPLTTKSELVWRRSSSPTPSTAIYQLATPDASPPLPPFMPLECPY